MIIVTIELRSAIHESRSRVLGRMVIANDGTSDDAKIGHYHGAVLRKPDFTQVTRTARVDDHRRLDKTIWHLVGAMLKRMGYA